MAKFIFASKAIIESKKMIYSHNLHKNTLTIDNKKDKEISKIY